MFSIENGQKTRFLADQYNKIFGNPRYVLFLSLFLSVAVMIMAGCQAPNVNPCFGFNAVAGIPAHDAIQADSYEDAAGRIRHKGIKWDRFTVLYRDHDGTGQAYRITAALQYLDESGSTPIVAELDSNMHSSTGINTMTTNFTHAFDFTTRHYYVEIRVTRTNTNRGPWVGGFNICEQFQ